MVSSKMLWDFLPCLRRMCLLMLLVALAPTAAFGSPPPTPAEAMVIEVYKSYAWEAVFEEPIDDPGLLQQPAAVLGQYFDPHMVGLIMRDRACEEKNGICRLDFDPIWDSQDPIGATGMKIHQMVDPFKVSVDFVYPGAGAHRHLVYVLSKTQAGWRISDIQSSQWSLRQMLEADFPY
jgi:hypothetical protein